MAARLKELHVRAAGATHSYSSLYPDEGDILLDMRNLKTLESGKRAERVRMKLAVGICNAK